MLNNKRWRLAKKLSKQSSRAGAKQKIFVKEYLKDQNGARAARAAGYSAHTARATATELLTKPHIRKAVDEGMAHLIRRADITAERILNRLAEFALDKKSIKPSDTLKATELLGKHLKLFTEVTEAKVEASVVSVDYTQVKAALEKAEQDS
jgi:phage terminase small subunit